MTARGFAKVSPSTNLCDGNIRNTCSFVLSRQIWSDFQDQTNCASTLSRRARWQVFTGKLHFFCLYPPAPTPPHPTPFLMRDSHQYLKLPWDLTIESIVDSKKVQASCETPRSSRRGKKATLVQIKQRYGGGGGGGVEWGTGRLIAEQEARACKAPHWVKADGSGDS